jgi:Tfp pilus assembly protein PilN
MQSRLNLATRPLENTRRFVLVCAAAGVVLLAMFFMLGSRALQTWRASRQIREEASQLQTQLREYRAQRRELEEFFKRDDTKQALDRAGFLNGLIEQRSFPWTRIFMDLERLLPVGARVISLAPRRDAGRIELHLVIGARDDDSKVRFLKALDEAPQFERVIVTAESRRDSTTADEDPLQLELVAQYRVERERTRPAPAPRVGGN